MLEKIISGEKEFEMRKCLPKDMKIGEDGFFVVEKGTDEVRCWCRVDKAIETFLDNYSADWYASRLCVPEDYVVRYANGKKVFLWKIGKVIKLQNLKRGSLIIDKNPQQFAYCPRCHGEDFLKKKRSHPGSTKFSLNLPDGHDFVTSQSEI